MIRVKSDAEKKTSSKCKSEDKHRIYVECDTIKVSTNARSFLIRFLNEKAEIKQRYQYIHIVTYCGIKSFTFTSSDPLMFLQRMKDNQLNNLTYNLKGSTGESISMAHVALVIFPQSILQKYVKLQWHRLSTTLFRSPHRPRTSNLSFDDLERKFIFISWQPVLFSLLVMLLSAPNYKQF